MIKLTDKMLHDEAEMRSFYESVGLSPATIEAAIRVRRARPVGNAGEMPKSSQRGRGGPRKRRWSEARLALWRRCSRWAQRPSELLVLRLPAALLICVLAFCYGSKTLR